MSTLEIRAQVRRGDFHLHVEVDLPQQGITAVLGPSGSGKTTLLRILAGLERMDTGTIRDADTLWADAGRRYHLAPQQRHIGMVFQDYALFAHMNVAQNIAYGLAPAQRAAKLTHCLQRLQLTELAERYPAQLSGGQRQRVALARALITEPSLLLLDEPFSAVDANLRQTLRRQLKASVAQAGCPVLLVTHYLEDVYYLADYIGVMVNGSMLQFGAKQDVLEQPNCKQVAELTGWQNFLAVSGISRDHVYGDWGEYLLSTQPDVHCAWLAVRAEHVQLLPSGESGISAQVVESYELGMTRVIVCQLQGGDTLQKFQSLDAPAPQPGEKVNVHLPQALVRTLPQYVDNRSHHPAPLRVVAMPQATNPPVTKLRR
jgi:molybdate transport system ATP-binding protein